jgi:mRNA interferase MazF
MARYVPMQGDIVWVDFNPQSGHEQAGRRPALVLSATEYNRKVGLMICCPLTNQVKGYPFEVAMKGVKSVSGVALADQIKSLDWRARNAEKKARVPAKVLAEVIAKTNALLRIEQ